MMKIPQYDLDGLGGEFKLTASLEKEIALYLGVKHAILVSSGTAAIFLALKAVQAKNVAVPALTMMGTATAAELAGCKIEFVSNNELPKGIDTYIHVSLNGRACGIDAMIKSYPGVTVVEDACQAFGSKYKGKFLGTFGKVGCFSFSPHKIVSAGNGGCVVTNDDDIAREVKKLKNFGRESGGGDQHDTIGYNFKFTDIQAKFAIPQLKAIYSRLAKKVKIYERYYKGLKSVMLHHEGVPWFVDIYVDNRDSLASYLADRGIGTRKMYPLLTEQKPFSKKKIFGDSSSDMRHSHTGLWLPSSLSLTDKQIDQVIDEVRGWIKKV
jgi:perosamine synthetase